MSEGTVVALIAGVFGIITALATVIATSMTRPADCLAYVDRLLAIDERAATPEQAQAAIAAVSWNRFEECGDPSAFLAGLDSDDE